MNEQEISMQRRHFIGGVATQYPAWWISPAETAQG